MWNLAAAEPKFVGVAVARVINGYPIIWFLRSLVPNKVGMKLIRGFRRNLDSNLDRRLLFSHIKSICAGACSNSRKLPSLLWVFSGLGCTRPMFHPFVQDQGFFNRGRLYPNPRLAQCNNQVYKMSRFFRVYKMSRFFRKMWLAYWA